MWIPAAKLEDLAPESAYTLHAADGVDIAVIRTRDGVFAIDNVCPHSGGSLGDGVVEGEIVTCPLHAWRFNGRTGACLNDSQRTQQRFEVKIEAGQVWVHVPPKPAAALEPAASEDPATKRSPVESWKIAKHGLDVWPDVQRYAQQGTPMAEIDETDLERMKWYGYFYRKNNDLDHYMCRIRIPGCELTAEQASAVARVAAECGYSLVDVTTRGNLQVQGLTVERLADVREALHAVGLTSQQTGHDNVRNVTSHPLSGIDPHELIDTRAFSRQLQDLVVGSREFSDLPRKFNLALTGRPDPAAHAWTQDICYVAARVDDGRVVFRPLLGGNQGQSPRLSWAAPVAVPPQAVVEVTAAVLRTFRELGYRHNRQNVRFRYLIERLGLEGVLAEVERRLGRTLERCDAPVPPPSQDERFVGWFAQKQPERWVAGVCVPLGRLTYDQLDGLASIARTYGDGRLRTAYDQNLLLPGVASAARPEVEHALAQIGLTTEPDPISRNTVACTGKQFCNIAVTETKGYAFRLMEELRRRKVHLHGIRLHMSGCPSSCAMSYTADIGLKGVKVRRDGRVLDAFDVYLGGGFGESVELAALYEKGVPFGQLADFVEGVVRDFYAGRAGGESFSQYWRRRLEGHKPRASTQSVPSWRCGRCAYLHVADDPPRFCPLCAGLRAQFEPAEADEATPLAATGRRNGHDTPKAAPAPPPSRRHLLIVGGGIAAHTAAQTARELDAQLRITLISDEQAGYYNRLNLTRYLASEVQRAALFDIPADWYATHDVEHVSGRVIALDPVQQRAVLDEGREVAYDVCILAHGSSANVPPFQRDLEGVLLLRTLDDVDAMLSRAGPDAKAVVIGGGVLGLEAAMGLLKRGASVRVLEALPRLMPRQLDVAAADLLAKHLETKGVAVHTGVRVAQLLGPRAPGGALGLGEAQVEAVTLEDGQHLPADLVVISVGIRPNVDWVVRSGIRCQRGVLVDDRMRTSVENVFACGDVVEWRGQVVGLWDHAEAQARVAATNAVGRPATYAGTLAVTSVKCLGLPLTSVGEVPEDGAGITSRVQADAAAGSYRRVVLRHGVPVGGILLGTSRGLGEMRKLIESGIELERLRQQVIPDVELVPT